MLCITSPLQSEQLALKSGIIADLHVASKYSVRVCILDIHHMLKIRLQNIIPVLEAINIVWHLNSHAPFMHERFWWERMLHVLKSRLSMT
jgi:hypothetical protein